MSQTLWDTTGSDVLSALLAERRTAGAMASGLALTLIAVVDEKHVREAEHAATTAAAEHPCRLLIVVPRKVEADIRLDAEVSIGGRLGPTEAVVMRMWGRLSLHAESVVLPLLAPDAPVVTWWHRPPPDEIATDALGVLANRRITDTSLAAEPLEALRQRAVDFVPGDTDLAWSRTTPWRSILASALDAVPLQAHRASVTAERGNPSAALLCGWLSSRLGIEAHCTDDAGPGISGARIEGTVDGADYAVTVGRGDGRVARLQRGEESERLLPLARRDLGDLVAEELRRMDPDLVYAEALAAATGTEVDERLRQRTHRWRDPAWREQQRQEQERQAAEAAAGAAAEAATGA
jgi:glucose-6-phosphate dehydrogenase assembly protein OpcA